MVKLPLKLFLCLNSFVIIIYTYIGNKIISSEWTNILVMFGFMIIWVINNIMFETCKIDYINCRRYWKRWISFELNQFVFFLCVDLIYPHLSYLEVAIVHISNVIGLVLMWNIQTLQQLASRFLDGSNSARTLNLEIHLIAYVIIGIKKYF